MSICALCYRTEVRAVVMVLVLLWVAPLTVSAQGSAQPTFSSSPEAAHALFEAAKAGDQQKLLSILGPESKEILFSGDEVADRNSREQFVEAYSEKHLLLARGKGTEVLQVGRTASQFPIPIVNTGRGWRFDTAAGKQEILFRRIGSNELATIRVCRAAVQAQREYASAGHDGEPAGLYAQKFLSDPGKQNGLYWKTNSGEPHSPLGPLLAYATGEGYPHAEGKPTPFHGYYYRILNAQGPSAPGGAKSYLVNGRLKKGFAFIAYPAQYRSSGVMTFMVNQDGILYQKDLGENTADVARQMQDYNPDKSWLRVH